MISDLRFEPENVKKKLPVCPSKTTISLGISMISLRCELYG